MSMRRISVDRRVYEWCLLHDCVRVRTDARTKVRIPLPAGYGACSGDWDDNDTAPVTPRLVANLIREHEGRPPVVMTSRVVTIRSPKSGPKLRPSGQVYVVYLVDRTPYSGSDDVEWLFEIHTDPRMAKERAGTIDATRMIASISDSLDGARRRKAVTSIEEEDDLLRQLGVQSAGLRHRIRTGRRPADLHCVAREASLMSTA